MREALQFVSQKNNKICWLRARVRWYIFPETEAKQKEWVEEGQPWATDAPTLHLQWLQPFSFLNGGIHHPFSNSKAHLSRIEWGIIPLPMKIPTLAFSCKLDQKHWHFKIICSPVIPRDPDRPDCSASGILTGRLSNKFPNQYALSWVHYHIPHVLLEVTFFVTVFSHLTCFLWCHFDHYLLLVLFLGWTIPPMSWSAILTMITHLRQ